MKFLHKYGTRSNEIRRARRELYFRLSLVLAVLLFFAAMIVITKFRPRLDEEQAARLPDTSSAGDPLTNPQLILMRTEIEELIAEFEREVAAKPVTPEELGKVEEAIDKQRSVIRLRGSEIAPRSDLERLEELLTLYDENMGQFLIAQSVSLEEKAEELMEQREYDEALNSLTRARNIQEEINEVYPRASTKDSTRLHRLNNRIIAWQTKPIADEADLLREQAYALAEEGRYAEARERIEEALEKQKLLNESHRESRFATIGRMRQMDSAWAEIHAAEDADAVQRLIAEARIALNRQDNELAQAKAEQAEVLQRRLMGRFPEQASASPEMLSEIQAIEDTASSLPAFLEIRELERKVRGLLRTREMADFKNTVSEWLRATRDFQRSYPGSRFANEISGEEVTFLHNRREEIPTLLETLYENFQVVPGQGSMYLYRTEIPQALYERITRENPSNTKDPKLPVESLTWEEARAFAGKLAWIMARPVSLPSQDLFRSALGNMDKADLQDKAWSSDNTRRATQPVGTTQPNDLGFYDLLGNVSEWIAPSTEEPQERVIAVGGSARDSTFRLATVPEEPRAPTERNRFVGFRIAVDMSYQGE